MNTSPLKAHLRARVDLVGIFCCSYSLQAVEALVPSGFNFLLFDAEHTPQTLPQLHAQLVALAGSQTAAIVRVADINLADFKRYLDLGVDGLMVPNVNSVQEAEMSVLFTRYPPRGVRGIAGTVRASRYGRDTGYLVDVENRFSLIVQVESLRGMENLPAIAAVDGVDAVFIGPVDLAADMGHLGQPEHPEVIAQVTQGLAQIRAAGKSAGVLASEAGSAAYRQAGANMIAMGSDLGLMVRAADALAERQRQFIA